MKRTLTKTTLGISSNPNMTSISKENEIQCIKREVDQLKDLEYDLYNLNDEISNIEAKYNMIKEQKDRNQGLSKVKLDISNKSLQELKSDVQQIKKQIQQTSYQAMNISRNNMTLQKTCENRENEITNLTISLRQVEKTNEIKNAQNQELEEMLAKFREHKAKMDDQCNKLYKKIDDNMDKYKCLDKETKNQIVLQKSLSIQLEKLKQEGEQMTFQMKSHESLLQQNSNLYQILDDQAKQISQTNLKLSKQVKSLDQNLTDVVKALENSQKIGKQKTERLRQLENQVFKCAQHLDEIALKKDLMLREHSDKATKHKDLNNQIDECLLKIMQLQNVKKVLKKNIENYIACDEEARIILDRKNKMSELLNQVNSKLSKTEAYIAHLK